MSAPNPSRACRPSLRLVSIATLLALLTGCAAVAPDGGVSGLQELASGKTPGSAGAAVAISRPGINTQAAIDELLKTPLSAEAAVRIALLNNPAFQLSLASAGISISDAMPAQGLDKLKARQDITRLAAETRKAWLNAVAAEQTTALRQDAMEAAQAGDELARRLTRVGNWSALQQAREQLLLSDAAAQLARARQAAFSAREKLIVLMGLWGRQIQFELPARLPELPAQPQDIPDVEARALQERQDLRQAVATWQRQQATTREFGADGLWDALRDSARVREIALKVRSEAREVYHGYRTAYDLALSEQRDVLPLHNFINEEMLLRYNGMLASVFELLSDSRAQTLGHIAAIEASRDFWLAEADLQTVLAGASATSAPSSTARPAGAAAAAAH
ncbi:hypothetical protein SAMN05216344_11951 [Polaromonas sp. OV174]|uniref:TolC family protein n=1 Tax=Polaromonas sp. OV174 TaxID=1855300 RepID=UPI0008E28827|nr:TolC family protein [Polaromonas sp. OV174]SFC49152.1 hypothetical protein SAMN05216344_11951 [Polaromonas sp. OV174]